MTNRQQILAEVSAERERQERLFPGESSAALPHGLEERRFWELCACFDDEDEAKSNVRQAKAEGRITGADILWEEVAEAFCALDDDDRRAELIQVAAVAVAMVEAIDRRRS